MAPQNEHTGIIEEKRVRRERTDFFLKWFNALGITMVGAGLFMFNAQVDKRIDDKLEKKQYLDVARYDRERASDAELLKSRNETLNAKFTTIEHSMDISATSNKGTEDKVVTLTTQVNVVIERLDTLRKSVDNLHDATVRNSQ